MIAARFVAALGELAEALIRSSMPAPSTVAEGSAQGTVTRGLVPCPICETEQQRHGVHFANNTELRPCAGSWGRR